MSAEPTDQNTPVMQTVEFRYTHSPLYRTVHMDGAYGGVTNMNLIHMAPYTELRPLPLSVIHRLESGELREQLASAPEDVATYTIEREIQAGLILDKEAAKRLIDWLREKVLALEAAEAFKKQQESNK